MPKFNLVKFDTDKKTNENKSNEKPSKKQKNKDFEKYETDYSARKRIRKRRRGRARNFLLGFIFTFLVIGVFGAMGISKLYNDAVHKDIVELGFDTENTKTPEPKAEESDNILNTILPPKKVKYNFAILGTDYAGTHTDFMAIGCYDVDKNTIKIMSVPRDTYTVMPQERIQALKNNGIDTNNIRSSGVMKMTEVHHHAGPVYGVAFALAQLEETFQVDFDYYLKFDLEGFRYLIDEIDGVEVNVPQRMYYNDPTQNLYIDLYPGVQTLNGVQAEGFVRYRRADEVNPISAGYARGDIGRIETQQIFIKAFIKKLTSISNLATSIPALYNTSVNFIDTNAKLSDITTFIPSLLKFDMDDLEIYTMPLIDEQSGFLYVKEPETSELIDVIFYDGVETIEEVDSSKLSVAVLNASYTSGLASHVANDLKDEGFNIAYIGDYFGNKKNNAEIRVRKKGYDTDFLEYFPDANVVVDTTLEFDVHIILPIE